MTDSGDLSIAIPFRFAWLPCFAAVLVSTAGGGFVVDRLERFGVKLGVRE